ncbi:Hypothetical protein SmN45_0521 [Serratia marcescens]|nr:Hypothetical protein SmN45_0521 [Serratia marcescens]
MPQHKPAGAERPPLSPPRQPVSCLTCKRSRSCISALRMLFLTVPAVVRPTPSEIGRLLMC